MTEPVAGVATKERLFAMGIDNLAAMFLGLLVASQTPAFLDGLQALLAIATYLAYFLVQEGAWSSTLGKRLFRLRVCRLDGSPCGWAAAGTRTLTRVIEVNPVLLGALPGCIAVALSKRHQRIGDLLAGCVVVRSPGSGSPILVAKAGDLHETTEPATKAIGTNTEKVGAALACVALGLTAVSGAGCRTARPGAPPVAGTSPLGTPLATTSVGLQFDPQGADFDELLLQRGTTP